MTVEIKTFSIKVAEKDYKYDFCKSFRHMKTSSSSSSSKERKRKESVCRGEISTTSKKTNAFLKIM
jgi:hypothetical protein